MNVSVMVPPASMPSTRGVRTAISFPQISNGQGRLPRAQRETPAVASLAEMHPGLAHGNTIIDSAFDGAARRVTQNISTPLCTMHTPDAASKVFFAGPWSGRQSGVYAGVWLHPRRRGVVRRSGDLPASLPAADGSRRQHQGGEPEERADSGLLSQAHQLDILDARTGRAAADPPPVAAVLADLRDAST
jgi:hypothetical protein